MWDVRFWKTQLIDDISRLLNIDGYLLGAVPLSFTRQLIMTSGR